MPEVVSNTAGASPFHLAGSLRQYASLSGRVGKRIAPCFVVLLAFLMLRALRGNASARLANEAFASGYALLAIVSFLFLLGVRKRLVTFALGKVSIWQRTHHYLGMLCLGAYVLHAGVITTGWLESLLAITFWMITLTGLGSWYVNRTAPRMLRIVGQQVLRQDIPEKKMQVAKQAYEIALEAAGKFDCAALAEHYQTTLQTFLSKNRSVFYRIVPTGTCRRTLLNNLESIDRYLSREGKVMRQQMSVLVQAKDDLDFQSAIQNRVRFMAGVHVWFLGGFVALTVAHVLAAYQFSSAW